MEKIVQKLKRILSLIERTFIWASGADLEILKQVPTEKNKYFGIGGTIIFTALMASFAGGYAFQTAFSNNLLSIFFGIFWGALIFNLDRYIVSTFGVGDGKKSISRQELFEALPRLLMAIILGIVISTPLELKIFEKEIKTKVERLKIEKKSELINLDSTTNTSLQNYRLLLSDLDNKIKELRQNKKSLIDNEVSFINDRKNELLSDVSKKDRELQAAQKKLNSAYYSWISMKEDTTGSYSDNDIRTSKQKYLNRVPPRDLLRKEKNELEKKVLKLQNDEEKGQLTLSNQINSEIENYIVEKNNLTDKIRILDESKDAKEVNYNNVANNYDGFAAHLEALSLITEEKPTIAFAKWLITLLFIFIEIAPILFKMMTERGPYDDIIDRIKHEERVKQLFLTSNINDEINLSVKANSEKNSQKLEAELLANKKMLESISLAQAEIAQEAIKQWKIEQIEKTKANVNSIIGNEN
jgi:hypothetical protein